MNWDEVFTVLGQLQAQGWRPIEQRWETVDGLVGADTTYLSFGAAGRPEGEARLTEARRSYDEDVILDRLYVDLVPAYDWAESLAAAVAWDILVDALRERGWLVIPEDAL